MIVFSAFLVVVAVALLVAGVVTSKLWLVYVAIGVSGVSLLALGLGAILKRNELFGQAKQAEPAEASPVPAQVPAAPRGSVSEPDLDALPQPAAAPAGYAWSASAQPAPHSAPQPGPPRAGYLPSDHSMGTRPPAAGFPPSPAADRPQPQPGRPADYERPPAAFTPRPAAGTPSPAPGVWEWRDTLPSAQPSAPSPPSAPPLPPAPTPPPAFAAAAAPAAAPAPFVPAEPLAATLAESDQPSAPVEQPVGSGEPTDQNLPASTDDQQAESQQRSPSQDQAVTDEAVTDQATEDQQQGPVQQEPEPAPDEQGTAAEQPAPASAAQPDHGAEPAPAEVDLLREVTVVPGVPRYHNAQCILIRFMGEDDLNRMPLGEARQAGCTPCRACQPDQP